MVTKLSEIIAKKKSCTSFNVQDFNNLLINYYFASAKRLSTSFQLITLKKA